MASITKAGGLEVGDFVCAITSLASTFEKVHASQKPVLSDGGEEWIDAHVLRDYAQNHFPETQEPQEAALDSLELRITARAPHLLPLSHGSHWTNADSMSREVEEIDPECLNYLPSHDDECHLKYAVLLSRTYSVPVLYFWVHDVQANRPQPVSIERIDMLIPASIKPQIRAYGVLGGVTISHHPIEGFPVYFVHPCNTSTALAQLFGSMPRDPTGEEYLLMWLGLVGPAAALHVPSSLAHAVKLKNIRPIRSSW